MTLLRKALEEVRRCHGACEEHVGAVVPVRVEGWGDFDYCEEAIAEDKRRGLRVSPLPIEPSPNSEEDE